MQYSVIYQYGDDTWGIQYIPQQNLVTIKPVRIGRNWAKKAGLSLIALALGGIIGPLNQQIHLETQFFLNQLTTATKIAVNPPKPLPPAAPMIFNPLLSPDGTMITPVDQNFSVIIPKIGVNAKVIPAVNPADMTAYLAALKLGVAHASTSYFPDEDGLVYLFSHSTNYDWFVRDLNAVFYLLKNLENNDLIVLYYNGKTYTYKITNKQVVSPDSISYLVPQMGKKKLILQTCWPPGSTAQRLLIFADFIDNNGIPT